MCGEIEEQISLDECSAGSVVEDQLLVGVCVYEFGVKLLVEGLVDQKGGVFVLLEEVGPRERLSLLFALRLEVFGADQARVGEGIVPVVHEDVVFGVVGADVFYFAHGLDGLADIVCESDGGEAGD